MSFSKTVCVFFSFFVLQAKPLQSQELTEVKPFGENPGNLRMFVHVPVAAKGPAKMPLVVVLHGCTQNAGVIAAQTGWNKLAEEYGFLVLYPQQKFINNPEHCFCWYRRGDITKGKGEDASIMEMIDYVKEHYRIDSSQVFVTGLSAGAFMSVALMATYPETFKSGAIFAGGAYKSSTSIFTAYLLMPGWIHRSPVKWGMKVRKQNPGYIGPYPNMIIYQGNKDRIVNRKNGFELVKQWTNVQHTDTVADEKIPAFAKNPDIEKYIYRDVKGKDVVTYYKVKRLGHAYLINPGACLNEGGKRGPFSRDKNYHATWWTAVDFGLVPAMEISGKREVEKEEKNLVFSITPRHPGAGFTWSFPEGCTVLNGAGTSSVTVNWGAAGGNVNVEETDSSGCVFAHPTICVQLK